MSRALVTTLLVSRSSGPGEAKPGCSRSGYCLVLLISSTLVGSPGSAQGSKTKEGASRVVWRRGGNDFGGILGSAPAFIWPMVAVGARACSEETRAWLAARDNLWILSSDAGQLGNLENYALYLLYRFLFKTFFSFFTFFAATNKFHSKLSSGRDGWKTLSLASQAVDRKKRNIFASWGGGGRKIARLRVFEPKLWFSLLLNSLPDAWVTDTGTQTLATLHTALWPQTYYSLSKLKVNGRNL